jgi:polysaccharide pyruvyl transferase WcaK-like protein
VPDATHPSRSDVRVLYANDYSSINHCGSKLLNANLKRALRRLATWCGAIRHDALGDPRSWKVVDACDVLVLNGEGNFHGGNRPKLGQIAALASHARSLGKRVALVNTVAARLPADVPLDAFDYVSVRESASERCLRDAGYRGELAVVPDATFLDASRPQRSRRERIVVTDCVSDVATARLHHVQADLRRRGLDARWAPFERGLFPRVSARRRLALIAGARLVVSGRFHANCFAMITDTPVVSIDSNTHKTRALMQDHGLGRFHFDGLDELVEFLRRAGAGAGLVPQLPAPDVSLDAASDAIEASLRDAIGLSRQVRS